MKSEPTQAILAPPAVEEIKKPKEPAPEGISAAAPEAVALLTAADAKPVLLPSAVTAVLPSAPVTATATKLMSDLSRFMGL